MKQKNADDVWQKHTAVQYVLSTKKIYQGYATYGISHYIFSSKKKPLLQP
jgi:hypothetical protein